MVHGGSSGGVDVESRVKIFFLPCVSHVCVVHGELDCGKSHEDRLLSFYVCHVYVARVLSIIKR